jgi:hypothetical protein
MNRLQKISSRLARSERPTAGERRRRRPRPPRHGSWRRIIQKLARHPDRYLI